MADSNSKIAWHRVQLKKNRATLKRIVEKGVGEMQRYFGSRPADLKAALQSLARWRAPDGTKTP